MTERTRLPARIAAFAVLLAVGAKIAIPFWPVPLTLQTLILAVIGLTLGPWHGLICVGCYIGLGLLGLPVFAGGAGLGVIATPNFGFLLGFLAAVCVIGLARGLDRFMPGIPAYSLAALSGTIALYAVAIPYYSLIKSFYGNVPFWAILAPFAVYLPGDLIKVLAAAIVAERLIAAGIIESRSPRQICRG